MSAVYCETHLPWCTITVYVAQLCMLNDRVCYLSSPLSAILSKFSGKTHFQQEFHLGLKIPGWSQTISNGSIGHVCENITYDEDSRENAVLHLNIFQIIVLVLVALFVRLTFTTCLLPTPESSADKESCMLTPPISLDTVTSNTLFIFSLD